MIRIFEKDKKTVSSKVSVSLKSIDYAVIFYFQLNYIGVFDTFVKPIN